MNNIKKFLLYGITIVVIVFMFVWEYYIGIWEAAQAEGKVIIRTDSFVLWPLVITLVALSLYQMFKKKE
ncbi:MAG: hypothetical protein ACI9SJ_001509 [Flavobacteriaceae bacterium]|jgi:hypothetical protein|uniref:hypothetical protein n=1 Tax=Candidatus Marifrigoribacter sp. Uisw_064 TaxID=3230970 RepID=UPI003AE5B11D